MDVQHSALSCCSSKISMILVSFIFVFYFLLFPSPKLLRHLLSDIVCPLVRLAPHGLEADCVCGHPRDDVTSPPCHAFKAKERQCAPVKEKEQEEDISFIPYIYQFLEWRDMRLSFFFSSFCPYLVKQR